MERFPEKSQATHMVLPPFCLEAMGLAFMAAEDPLAALLAALRAFTSLLGQAQTERTQTKNAEIITTVF